MMPNDNRRLTRPARHALAETLKRIIGAAAPHIIVDWHGVVDEIIDAVEEEHANWYYKDGD